MSQSVFVVPLVAEVARRRGLFEPTRGAFWWHPDRPDEPEHAWFHQQ